MRTAIALLLASPLAFADPLPPCAQANLGQCVEPAAGFGQICSQTPMGLGWMGSAKPCAPPADAPKETALVPLQVLTHDEQVACLTCADDLKSCKATDRVSFTWVWVAAGSGVVAGALIGLGVTFAVKK